MNNQIKETRRNLGITQAALAKAINTTVMSISQWERGIRNISSQFAVRLARYATKKGVLTTTDYLYGLTTTRERIASKRKKTSRKG